MTVEEIKAKLPEAEIYHLGPDSHYLFVLNSALVDMLRLEQFMDSDVIRKVIPPKTAFLVVAGDPSEAIRILEVKP